MDFALPETSQDIQQAVGRWVEKQKRLGRTDAFDLERWRGFLSLELLDTDPETLFNRCIGLIEAARAGLPGPVLEAQMALLADRTGRAKAALEKGLVVTSLQPGPAGPGLVGWGAVADLVFELTTGAVVAEGPLPAGQFAYPVPHGWYDQPAPTASDPLACERWLFGASLLSGLCLGALEITANYVKVREQFGNVLASYQAIQFPLAECKVLVDGVYLSALDAASRSARNDPMASVSCALAWLAATQVAERVTRVCHQSFGAFGFCYESGLVDLTWAMSWIRLKVGNRGAQNFLAASRRLGRDLTAADAPGCLVLEGFSAGHSGGAPRDGSRH